MKDDNKTEMEIMEILNARNSGNTELIQIATLSYLKGVRRWSKNRTNKKNCLNQRKDFENDKT